jgi:hypothetical protein
MARSPSSRERDRKGALARRRAELILKVRSGLMTATAAAKELGVSRKTYYEWENRALSAMMEALEDRKTGRPKKPQDSEKRALKHQVTDLEKKLEATEKTLLIREMLSDLPGIGGPPSEDDGSGARQRRKRGRKKRSHGSGKRRR